MNEEKARGSLDGASEDGALQEHIAHWVGVLDTWVKRVDLGMGRQTTSKGEAGDGAHQLDGDRLDESLRDTAGGVGTAKGVDG